MARTAFRSPEDRDLFVAEMPYEARPKATTIYEMLASVAERHGSRPAVSFQLLSGPKDPAETLTWAELRDRACQAANLFRSLGVGESDVVAYVMPNATETMVSFIGGAIAGIVAPINPLLDPEHIGSILHKSGAKVVVTLKSFPKTDVAQRVAEALEHAPSVHTVLEVDLNRYLTPPKSWIVPLLRPKNPVRHNATVKAFNAELDKQPKALAFADSTGDRVAAYFHTGGTTGTPKVAQHKYSGMIYNGWIGTELLFEETDNIMCPLPLFHVLACYPVVMSALTCGAHVVLPTPAGYRGDGVMDNFWKLVERWRITYMVTVPTAVAALMQRPVDADISSIRRAVSGSAAMPLELFNRFEKAAGIEILEGYGLTETTCLVSFNPIDGRKKVGSVGLPLPYTEVRILTHKDGEVVECPTGTVGEICVANPGVFEGSTYTEADKNHDLFHFDRYLRTGDLGKFDEEGYLWITGRAKDLIIRGGHNIDPAEIEEALAGHPAVALVGAIGQPDRRSGELPCAYVELVEGGEVSIDELMDYARTHIGERAAIPKHIEIVDELPKTAVGKVFKPDLRRMAITRVMNACFKDAGLKASVVAVLEDPQRGLVAHVSCAGEEDAVKAIFDGFTIAWAVKSPESDADSAA